MYLVSRTETFAKLFFVISILGLFMYAFLAFYSFHSAYFSKSQTKRFQKNIQSFPDLYNIAPIKHEHLVTKYILLWTINGTENPIGEGQEPFIKYNCMHQNCYITTDKELLSDYTDFHAIVFNASDLRKWNKTALPLKRAWAQKYVFFSKQPSDLNPICSPQADDFFNWTWSYKLYSDIVSPFIEVRDIKGDVVAPNYNVVWSKYEYEPLDLMALNKTSKNKAIASAFKQSCSAKALQLRKFILSYISHMTDKKFVFDVFGCKNNSCNKKCLKYIKDNYFFYLVHDGVYSEDFVTDALLTAIETNTVPVFVGSSDYTRFLPPSSYISIGNNNIAELEVQMFYAIENVHAYLKFFHWKKFYTINRTPQFHGLCQLCSNLNNPSLMETRTHYRMFRRWWFSGPLDKKCMKRKRDPGAAGTAPEWRVSYYKKMNSSRRKQEGSTDATDKDFDMVM